MQSFLPNFHSQGPRRKCPGYPFNPIDYRYSHPSPIDYRYSHPSPSVLPQKSRKPCRDGSECQFIATGCRFSHPSLNISPQKSVRICWNGSGCWRKSSDCPFFHPSASVPLKEAECLQIDRNDPHFGWVTNGVTTHDILNGALSYNGIAISKEKTKEVMTFINSQESTALIETYPCFHRGKKVFDGMFITMTSLRDFDQASNREKLLSLFEEIKKKFGFTWFPLEEIKPSLQISFDSVDEFYKRVKRDVQDIQLHDYWKKKDEEDWKKYNEYIFKTLLKSDE